MTTATIDAPPAFYTPPAQLAHQILPPGASTTARFAWLRARRQGIGATDALAVLGLHPVATPYTLWLDKTGRLPEEDDNKHMRRGRILEPAIAEWFTEDTGIQVTTTGMWGRRDNPVWVCNPDRFTADGGGLEIKTVHPRAAAARTWRTEAPEYPEGQAQYCMGVTGAPHWYVAGYTGESDLYVYRVERDEEIIDEMLDAADQFWRDYVANDTAPPVDGRPQTGTAIARALQEVNLSVDIGVEGALLRMRRMQLKDQIAALTAELSEVENEVAARMLAGGADLATCAGVDLFTYRQHWRSGYVVEGTHVRQLRTIRPGKSAPAKKTPAGGAQ